MNNVKVTVTEVFKVEITPELRNQLHLNQTVDNGSAYVSARHVSSGAIVAFWQAQLKAWAMTQPDLAEKYKDMQITGSFESCPEFTDLIKDFQLRHGLSVDGIIGPRTFRAFATRYYFQWNNGNFENLGQEGFEKFVITIISQEEYLRVISSRRIGLLSYYGITPTLPPGISAKEILNDQRKFELFEQIFLQYSGNNPPISARRFLELCAEYDFDPTLALAQAIQESNIGTKGRAVYTKNIFNVGNTDSGDNRFFSSFEDGMRAYLELMVSKYASTAEEFIGKGAMRIDGAGKYATDPNYTERIYGFVHRIRQHIDPSTNFAISDVTERFKLLSSNCIEVGGVRFKLSSPQDLPYMNPLLFQEVARAAERAGISEINVSCMITGHRYYTTAGYVSRHMSGNALDINMINGHHVTTPTGRYLADRLCEELQSIGFTRNREGSENPRSVLWQCPEHYNHIHVSNNIRPAQAAQNYLARSEKKAA